MNDRTNTQTEISVSSQSISSFQSQKPIVLKEAQKDKYIQVQSKRM